MKILSLILFFFAVCSVCGQHASRLPQLQVSENRRYLMTENGEPFFWLGDTGWLLYSKLDRQEAVQYLDDRAAKGFNVIQVMVLHQLKMANAYGDSALISGDVTLPKITAGNAFQDSEAYDFWDHVDYLVQLAEQRGLYMAMVPVWGSNVRQGAISREQADVYASWLAKRYADRSNIIWLNGGDTRGSDSTAIWHTMGKRLSEYAPNHLITFHPFGRTKSSIWFHQADWLDFNMFQSGHRRYDQDDSELGYGQDNWKYVRDDYALQPIKPTLDGEPSYEGIPQGLHDPLEPYWTADDIRRYAYWSVFAGACGFTYGHSAVMQMHQPGDPDPAYGVREYWTEALDSEGAGQMKYLKSLVFSKSYFDRIPDQSLIASNPGERYNHQVATRGSNYAWVYTYNGREIHLRLGKIAGEYIKAGWYNPRNGHYKSIGIFKNEGTRLFDPRGNVADGMDWVLVLESA